MTREEFFNFIEQTKKMRMEESGSLNKKFEDGNKFVVIDLDTRHAEVLDELPEVINGQWIVVVSEADTEYYYGYEVIGFFDKSLTKIEYIPLGFWLIKEIDFHSGYGCVRVDVKSHHVELCAKLKNRFHHSMTETFGEKNHLELADFSKFLDALWIHEIQTRDVDYNFAQK